MIKNVYLFSCKVPATLVILQYKPHLLDSFSKINNYQFYENPSSGRQVVPYGRRDGQIDMTNLIVAFRIFGTCLKIKPLLED